MAVFLTIITGVLVFVAGQIILRLFIDPWQRQRECIAQIAQTLSYYANIYSNPGSSNEDIARAASTETRRLASELNASCYRIPCYSMWSRFTLFPDLSAVNEARRQLIALANSTQQGDGLINGERVDRIRAILNIADDQ